VRARLRHRLRAASLAEKGSAPDGIRRAPALGQVLRGRLSPELPARDQRRLWPLTMNPSALWQP
jgi:hypothetical protein